MATTHIVGMPNSRVSFAVLRSWPLFALALASGIGAMYCSAQYALAASLTDARAVAADPDALAHWRRAAVLSGAGLAACLTLFVGSCVALRRRRWAAPGSAGQRRRRRQLTRRCS